MSAWQIMKARGAEFVRGESTTVFETVGKLETERSYETPSAQRLGEAWGEGEYLCLRDDSMQYERVTVVQAPATYITAEPDVPPLSEAA